MKRCILFPFFALLVLVLGLVACGADEVPVQAPGDAIPTNTALPDTAVPVPTDTLRLPTATTDPILASGLDWSLYPEFGSTRLSAGFNPAPFDVEVVAGWSRYVSDTEGNCDGFASEAPSYRMNWLGATDRLRIMFIAPKPGLNSMLIVNTPTDEWLCNDDASGTLNPMVELVDPMPGEYVIWVGNRNYSEPIPGTLRFTEAEILPATASSVPGAGLVPSGNRLDLTLSPNYGAQDLHTGFTPEVFDIPAVSGGTVRGDSVGCQGLATSAPDFRLNWSGISGRLRIMFIANDPRPVSTRNTTLIVHTPAGDWVCNDDFGGGENPMVESINPAEGQYDIWVGSVASGQFTPGTLRITEYGLAP